MNFNYHCFKFSSKKKLCAVQILCQHYISKIITKIIPLLGRCSQFTFSDMYTSAGANWSNNERVVFSQIQSGFTEFPFKQKFSLKNFKTQSIPAPLQKFTKCNQKLQSKK
jgi:hypothetical protein